MQERAEQRAGHAGESRTEGRSCRREQNRRQVMLERAEQRAVMKGTAEYIQDENQGCCNIYILCVDISM
jgi:hypothetical protein